MRRIRRNVESTVDAGLFQRVGVRFRVAAKGAASITAQFAAAVADEYQLYLLFKTGRIVDILHRDGAAAEKADVRERVEIFQSDCFGFHATHRQTGHGAVGLIGEGAEIGIDVGDQLVYCR